MLQLPPLALYVHIPWCVRKCPYCDFNSHAAGETLPETDYLAALTEDLRRDLPLVQGRKLASLFIGGGTPSLFSAAAIARIVELAEHMIGFAAGAEITLEANPGTFERQKFRDFYSAGINRLSIGVQSFNNLHLQALGRIHGRDSAVAAIVEAGRAGFERINIDLMHGLPGQTRADALADLKQATALAPEHISWYQLTIEPNTAFYSRPPRLPSEDRLAAIQDAGQAFLEEWGYRHYEVSAYARDERISQHNCNYWQFGDYLGIGAGAHGKITTPASDSILRISKTRQPRDYLARNGDFVASQAMVVREQRSLEFLMNALRLCAGVPAPLYEQRTGLPLAAIAGRRVELASRGLLTGDPTRIAPTLLGQRFLNDLLCAFD